MSQTNRYVDDLLTWSEIVITGVGWPTCNHSMKPMGVGPPRNQLTEPETTASLHNLLPDSDIRHRRDRRLQDSQRLQQGAGTQCREERPNPVLLRGSTKILSEGTKEIVSVLRGRDVKTPRSTWGRVTGTSKIKACHNSP